MNWILLILGIVAIVGAYVIRARRNSLMTYGMSEENKAIIKKKDKGKIAATFFTGIAIIVASQTIVVINTGYTGVRQTFGQISEQPVPNGFNIKVPLFQKIEPVNNKLQDKKIEEQIWGETANRTAIWYQDIVVTYKIQPEKSAWIYANVTDYKESLVSTAIVASAVKGASTNLQDAEATNREKVEPLVKETLQQSIDGKYGPGVIEINKIVINSANFEDSYKTAIAEKQKAQLAYEQQQIENRKQIEQAEAQAQAKIKEAEGQAEANRRLNESISSQVLQKQMLDKWNGELPKVTDGGNILDISNLLPTG